ncbi:MAG TPA: transposase, partial [Syntrophales bacterium]|nr:transposase [Syntrophales bacterium]
MPRANRHFLPDHVWHITHRCHKSSFLLKFSIDRSTWVRWLFEAKKRYGLEVLNYAITSNHIHLLIYGGNDREVIPKSVQLVAGRTAQAYNRRKKRNGAFWEDRYHATAIDTEEHLIRCLLYIDLNMVRAGVVNHPGKWRHCGYHELMNPPKRYRIIARERLRELLGMNENFNDIY